MVRAVVVVVIHLGNAGMAQRRGMPGFGPEAIERLRVLGILGAKYLDGHWPIQHDVYCLPHLTSAADRDAVAELVPACEHSSYLSHDNQTLSGFRHWGGRTAV